MGIRPIDLQVLIPHATDVGKTQQIANQQPGINQQIFSEQFKQVAEQKQQQVQKTTSSEDGKITREQEKKQNQSRSSQQRSSQQSHDGQTSDDQQDDSVRNRPNDTDPLRGHSIDIKL